MKYGPSLLPHENLTDGQMKNILAATGKRSWETPAGRWLLRTRGGAPACMELTPSALRAIQIYQDLKDNPEYPLLSSH